MVSCEIQHDNDDEERKEASALCKVCGHADLLCVHMYIDDYSCAIRLGLGANSCSSEQALSVELRSRTHHARKCIWQSDELRWIALM